MRRRMQVSSLPTLRFLRLAELLREYSSLHRPLVALFLRARVDEANVAAHYEHHAASVNEAEDKAQGFMMHGFLLVNRVPGNFRVTAHSRFHSFDDEMFRGPSLSHAVLHLSFDRPLPDWQRRRIDQIHRHTDSLDGRTFVADAAGRRIVPP
mmetsp:Transcript_1307/g.3749  ORF Transcript_1307/g.3749 Transcript_1307/m.3749 type:complete len:152 (-) Transcript_1307:366-821(-)